MSDDEPQRQPSWTPGLSDDEDEDLPGDRELVRSNASIRRAPTGGKAPRSYYPSSEHNYGESEVPDLGTYFEEWDMDPKDQIVMCRAYASYISASKKAKKK